MQALRKGAQASARVARTSLRQQQRRSAGSSHGDKHYPNQVQSAPYETSERLGASFYIGVACIPGVFLIHDLATSENPYLTRVIASYADFKDEWFRRNDLHNSAVVQAAADRNLFLNSKGSDHIDLKHVESFNQGSPYNVWAGAYTNLDKVIAHYQKKNEEEQAKRWKLVEEGKAGKIEYDPRMKNFSHQPTLP